MQIEEAIEVLKGIQDSNIAWLKATTEETCEKIYLRDIEAIRMVLNELEEQTESNKELNKVLIHFKAVINEMAKYINNKDNGDIYDLVCTRECENNKCRLSNGDNEYQELECIKEFFYKKVESKRKEFKYGVHKKDI